MIASGQAREGMSPSQQSCSSTQTDAPDIVSESTVGVQTLGANYFSEDKASGPNLSSVDFLDALSEPAVEKGFEYGLRKRPHRLTSPFHGEERGRFSLAVQNERAEPDSAAAVVDKSELMALRAQLSATFQPDQENISLQMERQRCAFESRIADLKQELVRERAELNHERGRNQELSIKLRHSYNSQSEPFSTTSIATLLDGQKRLMKVIEHGKESGSLCFDDQTQYSGEVPTIKRNPRRDGWPSQTTNSSQTTTNSSQTRHGAFGQGDWNYAGPNPEEQNGLTAQVQQELCEIKTWMVNVRRDVKETIKQTDRLQRVQLLVFVFILGLVFAHIFNVCGAFAWTATV